ncbi:Cutinase [Penicillium digitatum]|uniref:Cutinase n=1 Tax=Penicillium digitatum TaxID=36651 RepID=A0A7T6XFU1_PENDI|nr:Cutinase [Penicillium digitatum]
MGGMILKIAWALLAAISGLTATYAQSMPEDECATGVHAIIARGQGGGDDLNVMSTLSDLILKQIPGSTTLGLPYDHENVLTDFAKLHTVHDGAVLMQQFVQEYSESCPQAKIVVVGYSMGAVLMMDSLCGTSEVGLIFVAPLARFYNSTIIAAIAYGDETYIPGMPWNVGSCILGIGLLPRLNSALCGPFATSLHSYCDYGDAQCCSPYPEDGNAAHHGYIWKYNQDVVDFIKYSLTTIGQY